MSASLNADSALAYEIKTNLVCRLYLVFWCRLGHHPAVSSGRDLQMVDHRRRPAYRPGTFSALGAEKINTASWHYSPEEEKNV